MTTVAQMIEWLKTLPPEAEVQCGEEINRDYSSYMVMSDVDIESCVVYDFREGDWKPHLAGRVIVEICSS